MRKNVAEVVSNHCCLFFSHVECMEMRDKDHFPSFFAVRSAMWLCSGPWDVTLRFWVQGCYLNFMHWPSWQNRSHVTEQQDGAWDFEAMEEDNSLDICIMRPVCERKKLLSAEVPVTMAFIMAVKPVTQLTRKDFWWLGVVIRSDSCDI